MSSPLPVHTRECFPRTLRYRTYRINRIVLWLSLSVIVVLGLHTYLQRAYPDYAQILSAQFPYVTGHAHSGPSASPNPATTPSTVAPLQVGTAITADPSSASYDSGPEANGTRRANAVLLMLARNSELDGALSSVRQLEDRFNKRFGYPWVFLNEVPFTDEFKEQMSKAVAGPVSFGLIPREHWFQPEWIDEEKASASRAKMEADGVVYGGSLSYRNMCRFNSGFFYRHPLLLKHKWYWRVEPNVKFHCDTDYDPFLFMEDNDKIYGFTLTAYEFPKTILTLWDAVKEFIDAHPEYVSSDNSMAYLSRDGGRSYSLCHFWSNFEIADMDFWRGEAYGAFFAHLEAKGGFYYERWGDAPVHSIGAGLLARKAQVHFFDDVGYAHHPWLHCPLSAQVRRERNCSCGPAGAFDYNSYSCLRQWQAQFP